MRVGLSIDPPLATIPALLSEEGVDVYQTVLRDPGRFGNYGVPEPADRTALMEGLRGRRVWGVAHGSLLINLASPEGRIRNSSVSSLLADLKVAAEVGLDAVCFHVGYTKGHPSAEAALTLATRKLGELIARMPAGPRLLLENSCEGSEMGQTIPELARLVRDVGAPTASAFSSTRATSTRPASISRQTRRASVWPTPCPTRACSSAWSPSTSTTASFPAARIATGTLPPARAPSAWA